MRSKKAAPREGCRGDGGKPDRQGPRGPVNLTAGLHGITDPEEGEVRRLQGALNDRPETPRDLAHSMKSHYWSMAEHFAERAARAKSDPERCRYAAAAQRYRNLVKAEEFAEAALQPHQQRRAWKRGQDKA